MSSASSSPTAPITSSPTPTAPSDPPQAVSGRSSGEELQDRAEPSTTAKPFNFALPVVTGKMVPLPKQIPVAKRTRFNYRETIVVIAGESCAGDEQRFVVHTEVVTAHSKFFAKACHGKFKEAGDAEIRLPEVQAETFKAYVHWLYTGSVVVSDNLVFVASQNSHKLAELYVAADMLDDLPLRNAIVDVVLVCMAELQSYPPCRPAIELLWSSTPKTSPMRRLIIEYFQVTDCPAFLGLSGKYLPHEFLLDVLLGRMTKSLGSVPTYANPCSYHEHNDEFPKCGSVTTDRKLGGGVLP